MRVAKNRVISIDYMIRLADGEVVEASTGAEPLRYLHGRAQIVPGVERAIEGREAGAEVEIDVPPEDGYGERDPEGVFMVPREAFPDEEPIAPGMTFSAVRPDGRTVLFRVVRATGELILVDTNHPLAGQSLHVWVAVRDVREATGDELHHGRVQSAERPTQLPS